MTAPERPVVRSTQSAGASEFVMVEAPSNSSWVMVDEPSVPSEVRQQWDAVATEQDAAIRREKNRRLEEDFVRQAEALRRLQTKAWQEADEASENQRLGCLDAEQRLALAVASQMEAESAMRLRQRQEDEELATRRMINALPAAQRARIPTACRCMGASANIHKPSCPLSEGHS
jgi:hypothetical protein